MIKYFIFLVIALELLACSKEDNLLPSDADKNWYTIENKPGELNQLRYKIYKDYGCPVYYNDTLGCEFRGFDSQGDSIIYWETLKIGYTISGKNTIPYTLSQKEERLIAATRLLDERVMPLFQEKNIIMPRAILLVDSIKQSKRNNKSWYTGRSMTSLLIGMVIENEDNTCSNIETMTEDETEEWIGRIISAMYTEDILKNDFEKLENEFYKIIEETGFGRVYGRDYAYFPDKPEWYSDPEYFYPCEKLGFLNYTRIVHEEDRSYNTTPTAEQNFEDFMTVALITEDEKFYQKYEKWDVVKKQYKWMKEFLREKGIVK